MPDWIFDLGVSDGQDTAYYLAKGFNVVGVEADPAMYETLQLRFSQELKTGRLHLLNKAASESAGNLVEIHVHQAHQGISGINIRPEPGGYVHHAIESIDWISLCHNYGVPRYLKIDIEGSEDLFLTGMLKNSLRPEFISIEAYKIEPIMILGRLGYTRFKMVDQTAGFVFPVKQLEGETIQNPDFTHASGPFGLDVFSDGLWESIHEISQTWNICSKEFYRTWFDCHAWLPSGNL